jgi:hypothetical protein
VGTVDMPFLPLTRNMKNMSNFIKDETGRFMTRQGGEDVGRPL